ncbi:MAG: hypothetical protein ACLPY5_04655 [Candidatus Bathyarchaeia archaeon]
MSTIPGSEKWYCYKDNQVWLVQEKRWLDTALSWKCQCGHLMTRHMHEGSIEICDNCKLVYSYHAAAFASRMGENVIAFFPAIYIEGLGDVQSSGGLIFISKSSLNIILDNGRELEINYSSIESLNILLQREITALRTFLIGPMFAAWLKKETKTLSIGFRDELKLIQTPKLILQDNDELTRCYNLIMEKIRKNKRVGSP